jgi:hypothetical protein
MRETYTDALVDDETTIVTLSRSASLQQPAVRVDVQTTTTTTLHLQSLQQQHPPNNNITVFLSVATQANNHVPSGLLLRVETSAGDIEKVTENLDGELLQLARRVLQPTIAAMVPRRNNLKWHQVPDKNRNNKNSISAYETILPLEYGSALQALKEVSLTQPNLITDWSHVLLGVDNRVESPQGYWTKVAVAEDEGVTVTVGKQGFYYTVLLGNNNNKQQQSDFIYSIITLRDVLPQATHLAALEKAFLLCIQTTGSLTDTIGATNKNCTMVPSNASSDDPIDGLYAMPNTDTLQQNMQLQQLQQQPNWIQQRPTLWSRGRWIGTTPASTTATTKTDENRNDIRQVIVIPSYLAKPRWQSLQLYQGNETTPLLLTNENNPFQVTFHDDETILAIHTDAWNNDNDSIRFRWQLDYEAAFLPARAFAADANRGWHLLPMRTYLDERVHYSSSLVLMAPVPDRTMPFNVYDKIYCFVLLYGMHTVRTCVAPTNSHFVSLAHFTQLEFNMHAVRVCDWFLAQSRDSQNIGFDSKKVASNTKAYV